LTAICTGASTRMISEQNQGFIGGSMECEIS